MTPTDTRPRKITILSGSGISAESGLPTFRDAQGLWKQHAWQDLASPEGWARHPEVVLDFYNERRRQAWAAEPNDGHRAIASLEAAYEVVVVTQNVDALHERAGSTTVLHVHGELAYARGSFAYPPFARRYRVDGEPIALGQCCEDDGSQLRPDIVWFGEEVRHLDDAWRHVATAEKVLVVGTSLTVFPAASLVTAAQAGSEKVLVSLDALDRPPHGFAFLQGRAAAVLPGLAARWLQEAAGRG